MQGELGEHIIAGDADGDGEPALLQHGELALGGHVRRALQQRERRSVRRASSSASCGEINNKRILTQQTEMCKSVKFHPPEWGFLKIIIFKSVQRARSKAAGLGCNSAFYV